MPARVETIEQRLRRVEDALARHTHDLDVQFTRIADLQASHDELRARLEEITRTRTTSDSAA
jgi:hypothetical protein